MPLEFPRYHSSYIDLAGGRDRYQDSIAFIREELGVKLLTPEELEGVSDRYAQDLVNGLKHNGSSSLAMYDTYLPLGNKETLPYDQDVLVIEIGGTNIRASVVRRGVKGIVEIKSNEGDRPNFLKRELDKIVYGGTDEFFAAISEQLDPVLSHARPKALAFIWSFPGSPFILPNGKGVDIASVEELTKGFVIPGISRVPVGEAMLSFLNGVYHYGDIPYAGMNDTRAVGGGIVATGYNLLIGSYNTESGGFDKIYRLKDEIPWMYREIDKRSENPGMQLSEKHISGKYLGMLINIACDRLASEKLITQYVMDKTSVFISNILGIDLDKELRREYADPYMYATLMNLANMASGRSAQLVGTQVGTGIVTIRDQYPPGTVVYPIEGSVFTHIPGYKEKVEFYANKVSRQHGVKIVCPKVENAGIIGAGTVALGLLV